MNRNIIKLNKLKELAFIINKIKTPEEIEIFLNELLTESEIDALSKRWRILNMLLEGQTQREIATNLNVSLCKVTRGAKILKNNNSVTSKYLIKEKNNGKQNL